MQLTSSVLVSLVGALVGTSISAFAAPTVGEGEFGLTLPANITRGVPFEVTFQADSAAKGPTYVYAQYGLELADKAVYPSLGLPAFVKANGAADTGKSLTKRLKNGHFTLKLTVPTIKDDGLHGYLKGDVVLSMALYGTTGGRMDPIVTQLNQTTHLFAHAK